MADMAEFPFFSGEMRIAPINAQQKKGGNNCITLIILRPVYIFLNVKQ